MDSTLERREGGREGGVWCEDGASSSHFEVWRVGGREGGREGRLPYLAFSGCGLPLRSSTTSGCVSSFLASVPSCV